MTVLSETLVLVIIIKFHKQTLGKIILFFYIPFLFSYIYIFFINTIFYIFFLVKKYLNLFLILFIYIVFISYLKGTSFSYVEVETHGILLFLSEEFGALLL